MIDTVILNIPNEHLRQAVDGYSPITWDLNSRTINYEKFVRNPSYVERSAAIYMPRLTYFKRRTRGTAKSVAFLRIEFSVPKLLYQNNLDEIEESDFPQIIKVLNERLVRMNIKIEKKYLSSATVSAAHFSKNIVITGGYTASAVCKELAKVNLNKKFDLNKTDFRNDGRSLQCYTAAHSIVFYDKVADLAQRKKRAIDKDRTPQQLSLFEVIRREAPSLEILRMEIRLSQKQKLNSVLARLGFPTHPTFRDVINKDVCQKVLQYYWSEIIRDENQFIFELAGSGPKQVLKEILQKSKKVKAKEVIYLTGLKLLSCDAGGIRELREMLQKKTGLRNWYRISTGFRVLNSIARGKRPHSWLREIDAAINRFEPYMHSARAP